MSKLEFNEDIEKYLPVKSFSRLGLLTYDEMQKDHLYKFRAYNGFLNAATTDDTPGSLLLGLFNKFRKEISFQKVIEDDLQFYNLDLIFDINDVFSGIASEVIDLNLPSFCYFHLYPPHDPYVPKRKFRNLFSDQWKPDPKTTHPLLEINEMYPSYSESALNDKRQKYDQFIATTDAAFGNFLNEMEKSGLLENSYVILTSDHGESFERGYWAHAGPFAYEPGVRVPLIISTPGQTVRNNIHSVTNSVDLLPTLLNISGLEIPTWSEGKPLPGFGEKADSSRLTFSMDAKGASAFGNLSPITLAMYQGDYKIIYYKGYGKEDSPYNKGLFELYNLKDDPEELKDLIEIEKTIAQQMKSLLLDAYDTAKFP